MRLTKRDYNIMWRLHLCRWLSTTQIKREYFATTTLQAVNRRLKMLVDAGFLFTKQPSKTEECYFRLGLKGKFALAEKLDTSPDKIQTIRAFPVQLKHFSTLNDIRWICEKSIESHHGSLEFFFVDKELKGLLKEYAVIPDALLSFKKDENSLQKRFILAIEYDAGTENPQYFGRDKVKKYCDDIKASKAIFAGEAFRVLVLADTRKRILSLIRHSIKFLNKTSPFYFASMEDLFEYGSIFSPVFIATTKLAIEMADVLCSAFE